MEIKKLNDKMESIIEAIGGNEVSNGMSAPKAGNIKVKDMVVMPARDQQNADGSVTHINSWVRVDFEEGGSLSLRSLLISPDITWDNKGTQDLRIKALAASDKLTFTHSESKTSKAGNPYKVAHVMPITL
jgi:hypothetical protein